MNNIFGALLATGLIGVSLLCYLIFLNKVSKSKNIVSQAMLLHRFNNGKKYARKINTKSQSKNHYDKTNIKVIIVDGTAYWIKDNTFYKAPLVDHMIDKESAQQVDTTDMNKVQLDQMLFILDKLKEGVDDDSGRSRNE
jgi:hypothetical protein